MANMNMRLCWNWSLLLALIVLPLAGCVQQPAKSPELNAVAPTQPPPPAIAASDSEQPADFDSTAEPEISDAPVTQLSSERPLPLSVRPDSPLAEAIKLASSRVE